jgi:hypothetical protein
MPYPHPRQFPAYRHSTDHDATTLLQPHSELNQRGGWISLLQLLQEFAMLIIQLKLATAASLGIRTHVPDHRAQAAPRSTST